MTAYLNSSNGAFASSKVAVSRGETVVEHGGRRHRVCREYGLKLE